MLGIARPVSFAVVLLVGFLLGAALTSESQRGTTRRYINRAGRTDTLPFSHGVLAGNTLYLSGTIGVDPRTGRPPDDLEAEIRLVLDSMKGTLADAGMTMDNLVTVQVFCPDLSLYDRFNTVYRSYFGKDFPARAFIGSGPLLRGGHFEVQGIAVK
jgi:2-iminobutanoate/2-iminopropanoate deaminase